MDGGLVRILGSKSIPVSGVSPGHLTMTTGAVLGEAVFPQDTTRALLRLPLALKLVGAQVVVLALCLAFALLFGWRPNDSGDIALLVFVAAAGLLATVALVLLALRPLRLLETTARQIGKGDYDARVPDSALADRTMERLSKTMNVLLDQLTEDRRRMRELASEVIRSGDEERSQTAWRLHESAAQSIASVTWQLAAIAKDISDKKLEDRLLFVKGVAEDVLADIRQLAETMHPRVLQDLGLAAALTQLARQFEEASGVHVTANVDRGLAKSIDRSTAAALYRAAHEAISNAIRHAKPTTVRIWFFEQNGSVRLEVVDDGSGFDVGAAERNRGHGTGIFAMRERLALANTELFIESTPGQGTRVCAYVGKKPAQLEKMA